ncbi:ATP-dependent nuclease [Alteromonas gracilis]|uniref:ATP-dependent nuclease n=1 Tax=Alteromonas gracilis TaxID=1479524 RepID=UPI0030D59D35
MDFFVIKYPSKISTTRKSAAYLVIDSWDDYSFSTLFTLFVVDDALQKTEIGTVKIGFLGQDRKPKPQTSALLNEPFQQLDDQFFSLGQDVEYYKSLNSLDEELKTEILTALRDIPYLNILEEVENESVFEDSLLRTVSRQSITEQFTRVIKGDAALTNYNFLFEIVGSTEQAGYKLDFDVYAESKPSTNIHVIIGRNGVGKTTLFRKMIESLHVGYESNDAIFRDTSRGTERELHDEYFGGTVSIAFSAFDPFEPLEEQPSKDKGSCYFYVGLKKLSINQLEDGEDAPLKTIGEINQEFTSALGNCFSQVEKRKRWLKAIRMLESDENFAEMQLGRLAELRSTKDVKEAALHLISRMSSGHTIVLLSITRLVQLVEEKTLVLIDEPESHLHPPLLSAFLRALSDLLYSRNGVAIIATHSPVVLQEVPRRCVWKLNRVGLEMGCDRPDRETFGENVGVLTRAVFGLEVWKSGFHSLLQLEVDTGGTFEDIVGRFDDQLGIEGRAVLKSLILDRDTKSI